MSHVAIVTRTIDRPALLERMLQSLISQTFGDWELVVVDSSPEASAAALLKRYELPLGGRCRHLPFVNPKPGMRGVPLNAGIAATTAPLITVLDDDDTWDPRFLESMVTALERHPHPSVAGVVCRSRVIEESTVAEGLHPTGGYDLNPDLVQVSIPLLAQVNRFCIHAFMYRRDAWDAVGGYPEDYPVLEDWHFNLRFVLRYEVMVVPEILTYYHIRPGETAGSLANSQVADRMDHKFHEARLVNEAIRTDLFAGRAGLGFLLSQAAMIRPLADALRRLENKQRALGDKIGKIDSRTKDMKKWLQPRGTRTPRD